MRIRRKLDEACACPGSIFGIDVVAQLATDILSLIEAKPSAFDASLVNLAMEAHALAYIALISCLYGFDQNGRRKIKRKDVRSTRRLLTSVHILLVKEALGKGILMRIKRAFIKGGRNNRVLLMNEELLDILRDIENDENANILKSLSIALDCPYQ
ncbi:hypothetical protein D9619_012191 [Psilocybe cf. subviscida]|uniref:Uncharacterized protein n=1 Tax=Psilocybe cf. subviscida TaxID=2480587 RepID=A0A8H5EZJ2_9AGAR|nr:hypothetical protein D9619_012191 [Psilocybe cf. subviscida]